MKSRAESAFASELLSAWKQYTRQAMAATLEHHPISALEHYRHARQAALQLLASESSDIADDERIAAFVVAHLNLADSYAQTEQPGAALDCLYEAQQALMPLLQQGCTHPTASESLKLAVYRHLPRLKAAWIECGMAQASASSSGPESTHPSTPTSASERPASLASFEPVAALQLH